MYKSNVHKVCKKFVPKITDNFFISKNKFQNKESWKEKEDVLSLLQNVFLRLKQYQCKSKQQILLCVYFM